MVTDIHSKLQQIESSTEGGGTQHLSNSIKQVEDAANHAFSPLLERQVLYSTSAKSSCQVISSLNLSCQSSKYQGGLIQELVFMVVGSSRTYSFRARDATKI